MATTAIDALLSLASDPTGPALPDSLADLPPELAALLDRRNGFFAFETALEVFPAGASPFSYSLAEWNGALWKPVYGDMAPPGVCFAQDICGMQFFLDGEVYAFDPETAEVAHLTATLEEWARKVVDHSEAAVGQPLAHAWRALNGRLPPKRRLTPLKPFVLGGPLAVDNLVALDAAAAMRLRAELAHQLRDIPDGVPVRYRVVE